MRKRWAWVGDRRFCHAFSIKQSVLSYDTQNALASGEGISLRRSLKENRDDQNREDIDDLDHRIDRRTSGIFVRVADRVTGDCRLVCKGTFASEVAFFNELFGVVPRSAAGGHRDRDKKAGDNCSY